MKFPYHDQIPIIIKASHAQQWKPLSCTKTAREDKGLPSL